RACSYRMKRQSYFTKVLIKYFCDVPDLMLLIIFIQYQRNKPASAPNSNRPWTLSAEALSWHSAALLDFTPSLQRARHDRANRTKRVTTRKTGKRQRLSRFVALGPRCCLSVGARCRILRHYLG